MCRRPLLLLCALLLVATVIPAGAAVADDYTDPAYREHDLDNANRSRGGLLTQATSPSYVTSFATVSAQELAKMAARQVEDAPHGRVYGGVGWVPNFATGDPEAYRDVPRREVFFLARTGAKLSGHIWGSEAPGPRPGIVITTGGLASEQTYWWAAQALAEAGYVVMTYDVQNQGSSETFARPPGEPLPTAEGSEAFQDNMNFQRAKIDALRFFLSTGDEPYVPLGWSADDVEAATNRGERLDFVNPAWGVLDREHIGIAGHSNGAFASTVVQQCSDEAELWRELEICGGRSYPIRGVVAWDRLQSTTGGVEAVIPAMDQRADYMWYSGHQPRGVDGEPSDVLVGYDQWRNAGLDTMLVTVRGGTHMEWNHIPFINRTAYGNDLATYYTVAWMDRFVHPDPHVRQRGFRALLDGPVAEPERPWSANHLSVRYHSAMTLRRPQTDGAPTGTARPFVDVVDLREWAGRSPVGDWEGANADRQGRIIP
jgi:hypothetical protein